MAAVASSPMSGRSSFKSPLRNFRVETSDILSMDEIYADAESRVAQWRKDLVATASFDAQQSLRDLSHEREELKELGAELSNVQSLVQVASQLEAGGARLADVIRNSAEAEAMRAQSVARINADLQKTCESRKLQLQKEEKEITQQRLVADQQHAEALKLLATYQDRLGLKITREAPQTVRMAFFLIDEADSEREFHFTLGLGSPDDNSDSYCVPECKPHLPELPELLANLNSNVSSSAALPRFVCSMRRSFQKLAKMAEKN